MKKHLEKIPYLIFSLIIFIFMPISYFTLNNKSETMIYLLLVIFPIITFFISLIYSYKKENFSYLFSILIGIFYLLTCIIMFNFNIVIYSIFYIFISLCGQGTGFCIKKIIKKFKKSKKE